VLALRYGILPQRREYAITAVTAIFIWNLQPYIATLSRLLRLTAH
jgi:hypothetical protein